MKFQMHEVSIRFFFFFKANYLSITSFKKILKIIYALIHTGKHNLKVCPFLSLVLMKLKIDLFEQICYNVCF